MSFHPPRYEDIMKGAITPRKRISLYAVTAGSITVMILLFLFSIHLIKSPINTISPRTNETTTEHHAMITEPPEKVTKENRTIPEVVEIAKITKITTQTNPAIMSKTSTNIKPKSLLAATVAIGTGLHFANKEYKRRTHEKALLQKIANVRNDNENIRTALTDFKDDSNKQIEEITAKSSILEELNTVLRSGIDKQHDEESKLQLEISFVRGRIEEIEKQRRNQILMKNECQKLTSDITKSADEQFTRANVLQNNLALQRLQNEELVRTMDDLILRTEDDILEIIFKGILWHEAAIRIENETDWLTPLKRLGGLASNFFLADRFSNFNIPGLFKKGPFVSIELINIAFHVAGYYSGKKLSKEDKANIARIRGGYYAQKLSAYPKQSWLPIIMEIGSLDQFEDWAKKKGCQHRVDRLRAIVISESKDVFGRKPIQLNIEETVG